MVFRDTHLLYCLVVWSFLVILLQEVRTQKDSLSPWGPDSSVLWEERGSEQQDSGFKPSIPPWMLGQVVVPHPLRWVVRDPIAPCLFESNRDKETKQEMGRV